MGISIGTTERDDWMLTPHRVKLSGRCDRSFLKTSADLMAFLYTDAEHLTKPSNSMPAVVVVVVGLFLFQI